MDQIIEVIQKNNILKVALIIAGIYFIMQYYKKEGLDNTDIPIVNTIVQAEPSGLAASAPVDNAQQKQIQSIVAGTTQLTTSDLLPSYTDANDFAKQNPVSKILQEQNYLQAGHHMGIQTVIQSNKIPYLDIRSAPPIPKNDQVSPWMVSSYETPAGFGRKTLEIGN